MVMVKIEHCCTRRNGTPSMMTIFLEQCPHSAMMPSRPISTTEKRLWFVYYYDYGFVFYLRIIYQWHLYILSMEDHMDSIVQDLALPFDAPSMDEPELQFITFDVEELSSLAIADVLLEIEVEKFTFQDVMNIDSSSFEPEMEIFTIDDEATSDVKEPSSTNPLTTPSLVSSVEVVLKLLSNHLRYDPSLFDKACHIIDIAYTPCDLLMTLLNGILYRYAYAIGYSIDDLEGIVPITCVLGPFRFMFLHHQLQDDLPVDIPWDPDGCMVW